MLFEVCKQLSATNSYKEKERILRQHVGNDELRLLFKQIVDPNVQSLEVPWKVGVGAATLNKVWPGLIDEFRIMTADEVPYGPGESWSTMIHHLEDAKNWIVSGDPLGIRCKVRVGVGFSKFKTSSCSRITNAKAIEDDLYNVPGACGMQFDGRLCSVGRDRIADVYEDYVNIEAQDKERFLVFKIFDLVETKLSFEERYDWLESMPLDTAHTSLIRCEPVDYQTTGQVDRLKHAGFSKVLLRYKKSAYQFGKSRNMLSLKI